MSAKFNVLALSFQSIIINNLIFSVHQTNYRSINLIKNFTLYQEISDPESCQKKGKKIKRED